jgi:dihydrofolate reductase
MRKITVFNSISLDGRFTDANGDMSWAHASDPEYNAFVEGNAGGGGALLFGRVTYQMMAGFWPTPMAMQTMPDVAQHMNRLEKYVVSRTLNSVSWNNTTLLTGDLADAIRTLRQTPGRDVTILGSGTIVAQLAQLRLIDEFHLVVCPIVLGGGRTLFDGVRDPLALTLRHTRQFANGRVLLSYAAGG